MKLSNHLLRRLIIGLGGFYLAFLLGAVATASYQYRDLYAPPAIDRNLDEKTVLQTWERQYEARYHGYRRVVRPFTLSLALMLSIWAAAFGVWRKSLGQGLLALATGGGLTVLALSLLPWVYFPFDQYPVAALWVIGGAPWIALSWAVLTVVGGRLRREANQDPGLT